MSNSSNSWIFLAIVTASIAAVLSSLLSEEVVGDLPVASESSLPESGPSARPPNQAKLPGGGDPRAKFWAN